MLFDFGFFKQFRSVVFGFFGSGDPILLGLELAGEAFQPFVALMNRHEFAVNAAENDAGGDLFTHREPSCQLGLAEHLFDIIQEKGRGG
jgi:hypothetical protein